MKIKSIVLVLSSLALLFTSLTYALPKKLECVSESHNDYVYFFDTADFNKQSPMVTMKTMHPTLGALPDKHSTYSVSPEIIYFDVYPEYPGAGHKYNRKTLERLDTKSEYDCTIEDVDTSDNAF